MQTKSRAIRRIFARGNHIKGNVRAASRKSGQPEWFAAMKQEAAVKKILAKLPTSELHRFKVINQSQLELLVSAGFKTVWSVVDAKYADLLAVHGFGPKTLAKLKQDMMIKVQVRANWSVPSGG